MPDIAKMLVAAHMIKQRYDDEFILRAKVTQTDQARAAAHLCLTICELFAATTCLIEKGFSSHSPVFVRSMLEGMADLHLVVTDETHLDQMAFESAKSNAGTFERMASFTDRPEGTLSTETLEAVAAVSAIERDRLKKKGCKKQTMEEKLTKVGLANIYSSYRLLCGFTHNDLTTLRVRHSGPYLRYHHEATPAVASGMLQIAFMLLTEAVALLPDFSDIRADDFHRTRIQMDKAWAVSGA